MPLENSFIPYGAYWTTPFARWQGSLAGEHAMKLAARVANAALQERQIAPTAFDALTFGISVPQSSCFYGAPWMASMIGAPQITGPTIAQACATSARMLSSAALEVETGQRECVLTLACDRTSNGPHVYYPDPAAPGGTGRHENPVLDNFSKDPNTRQAMIQTAENVAAEAGITRQEQEAVTLLRHEQYEAALAGERAFQKRYMVPVELMKGRKVVGTLEGDEGVFPTTAEGLAKLRPVLEEGSVTFGSQTHPADANAGLVVCSRERARELSKDDGVTISILGFGETRVEPAHMPKAVVPAARHALQRAGIDIGQCAAVKTHNPFAVNDVYFCREMDLAADSVNRFGSPLIYGHPQAPMGLRVVMELIEELASSGGGYGLFSGCAAGDTAMAVVIRVD
ncbi:MAG: thiolase family protein [Planctomycetota bacterium]|nr:MAG: thiolase family protein [Planctomycetota bacterium]